MQSTLVLALAATALAAVNPLVVRQDAGTIVCETSDASPLTEDVTEMINNMNAEAVKDDVLCVVGSFGNDCSPTWRDYSNGNSAAVQICGEGGGGDFRCAQDTGPALCPNCAGIKPRVMAGIINKIQQECQSNGKVGGFMDYQNGDVKLIHS